MDMVLVICSETLEGAVEDFFSAQSIFGFTKIPNAQGVGHGGGPRLGDEIWPGHNTLYFLALDSKTVTTLAAWAAEYRTEKRREGLKIFRWGLKEIES